MTAAFAVVFSVFVLAMVVIAVLAVRWAIKRDRAARAARGGGGVAPPKGGP